MILRVEILHQFHFWDIKSTKWCKTIHITSKWFYFKHFFIKPFLKFTKHSFSVFVSFTSKICWIRFKTFSYFISNISLTLTSEQFPELAHVSVEFSSDCADQFVHSINIWLIRNTKDIFVQCIDRIQAENDKVHILSVVQSNLLFLQLIKKELAFKSRNIYLPFIFKTKHFLMWKMS
jgi:hypothetical protein